MTQPNAAGIQRLFGASGPPLLPGGSAVNNLPTMQETQEMRVRSLGQEDPLEEEMAIHSGILTWKVPKTEDPGGLQPIGSRRLKT